MIGVETEPQAMDLGERFTSDPRDLGVKLCLSHELLLSVLSQSVPLPSCAYRERGRCEAGLQWGKGMGEKRVAADRGGIRELDNQLVAVSQLASSQDCSASRASLR